MPFTDHPTRTDTPVVARLRRLALALFLTLAGLFMLGGNAHALACPDNQVKEGALCYAKPRDGYTCTATLCVEKCRDGYRSSGIGTCHYAGSTTYTEKPYLTRKRSGMQRCLALFYDNCRSGYRMDVCGICSYKGAWDITRASYDRGPGTNPDVTGAFRQVSITAQATYGRALHGAEGVYAQVLSDFKSGMDDVIRQAALKARSDFVNKNKAKILAISARFAEMMKDPETVNRMRRVVVAASKGVKDANALADMRVLAQQIGATSLETGWIFGVYGGFETTAGAGVNSAIGLMVELKTLGTEAPAAAAFIAGNVVLGVEEAVTAELGVVVQQGKVTGKSWTWNGPVLGISATAEADVGAGVGVAYHLPNRWPAWDYSLPDPFLSMNKNLEDYFGKGQWGFSVSANFGAGLGAAFDFGTEFSFALK